MKAVISSAHAEAGLGVCAAGIEAVGGGRGVAAVVAAEIAGVSLGETEAYEACSWANGQSLSPDGLNTTNPVKPQRPARVNTPSISQQAAQRAD